MKPRKKSHRKDSEKEPELFSPELMHKRIDKLKAEGRLPPLDKFLEVVLRVREKYYGKV